MSHSRTRSNPVHKRVAAPGARRPRQRRLAYLGLGLGVAVLAVAVLTLVFGKTILNGYGKGKDRAAFAQAYPECSLGLANWTTRWGRVGWPPAPSP